MKREIVGIPISRPAGLLAMAVVLMSGISMAGPFHQNKARTTVNLSQGCRHGDTIFFLADVHHYQQARTLWFILPLRTVLKTLGHQDPPVFTGDHHPGLESQR